jgi:tetratricopeptide (TPR) repeat protein
LPSAVPVAVFAVAVVAARVHGYANGWTVDPWRSVGGLTAAALALAVLPWRYGADRQPSTAVLLWLLPRLSADRVRAHYAPYADARLRGPLLAFGRAGYRQDVDAAARATAEVVAARAAPNLVRSCQAVVHGLRGEYLEGARAAAQNLDDLDRADVSDFTLLFACVLAGLEAGQQIPDDLVDLARGNVGNLAQACERDEFAEKHAQLALQDGKLPTAERWVRSAISWATNDIVEGHALLTLARLRTLQGQHDEAARVLNRARAIHPHCPRWQAVLRTSEETAPTTSL